LLKRSNLDLDLAVEGDGIAFARLVVRRYGAGVAIFDRFATARLTMPNSAKLDIASTRRESYAVPAALPDVRPARLEEDLLRRDFTINAMAIELTATHWGRLHDPYGGQDDLRAKIVRILHARSFVDDPTRIFRAIRFIERFGFRLDPTTRRLLKQAAESEVVAQLSGPRLANEIFLLMKERHPERALTALARLHLLRFLHPRLAYTRQARLLTTVLRRAIGWWERHCPENPIDRPLVWFMALLEGTDSTAIAAIAERLQLSSIQTNTIEWAGAKTSNASDRISGPKSPLRPSQVYRLLRDMPKEALILVIAKAILSHDRARVRRASERMERFITKDRQMAITVNGEDLKQYGLPPGPQFKGILDRLLDERIDGTIKTAIQERALARRLVADTLRAGRVGVNGNRSRPFRRGR
jgi:tRNA nucleotidyltransferase (CCA-adding enzyme)